MLIKKYHLFIETHIEGKKENEIDDIISHINENTQDLFSPYFEKFHIQRDELFLTGNLFLSINTNKAIRINWLKDDILNNINSIDIWENFKFNSKPDYSLSFKIWSQDSLKEIIIFISNPKNYIKVNKITNNGNITTSKVENERTEKDSDKISQLDLDINIYKDIEKHINSFINNKNDKMILISGQYGVGKSVTVIDSLDIIGGDYFYTSKIKNKDEILKTLFANKDKILVIDNYDEKTSNDILNQISSNKELEYNNEKFIFNGKLIVIINSDNIDNLPKSPKHIIVKIDKSDLIYSLKGILNNICIDVLPEYKEEVLEYLIRLSENYPDKYELNVKNLINSINLRPNNSDWKIIIKKHIINK
jgi:hypothetical protein